MMQASEDMYPVQDKHGKRFTKEEDALLKELAKDKKNKTWKEIATYLPGRTACQCRDRYNQYLFKEVVNKPWTQEEDEIIVKKYKQFGPHWVKISQYLPGRSGNNIKNHWNSALTKFHGISHKNPKQERRSRKEKFIDDEIVYATYEYSSPESTTFSTPVIEKPKVQKKHITPPVRSVIEQPMNDPFAAMDQTDFNLDTLFEDSNTFTEFENFAF